MTIITACDTHRHAARCLSFFLFYSIENNDAGHLYCRVTRREIYAKTYIYIYKRVAHHGHFPVTLVDDQHKTVYHQHCIDTSGNFIILYHYTTLRSSHRRNERFRNLSKLVILSFYTRNNTYKLHSVGHAKNIFPRVPTRTIQSYCL